MRVLAFCDHLSADSSGGAERVAAEVYGRLASEHGVDLTVLTVLRAGHRALELPGMRVVALTGHDFSGVLRAEMLLSARLSRTARSLHRELRPHVLHGNGLHFQGTVAAARLARRTGTPLVTTAHLGDLAALSPLLRAAGTVWDGTLGRYAVARSARCVAVSAAVGRHLRTLGAVEDTLTVAPNGVDHERFHTTGRDQLGTTRALRAVFVGRLIANKGPAVAVDAVAGARRAGRHVSLTVLGDGPLREALHRSAAEKGIAEHVHFAGHVQDVSPWLRSSDVLLRPSLTEGLPLAVLEAMACGLPVVCSNIAGNTEVVTHGVTGLHTEPLDVPATAAALVRLADEPAYLQRLGTAAEQVAAHHTWQRSAALHLNTLSAAARSTELEKVS